MCSWEACACSRREKLRQEVVCWFQVSVILKRPKSIQHAHQSVSHLGSSLLPRGFVVLQCGAPYCDHLSLFTSYPCVNLIGSRASRQTSYCCKSNTVAWVVELTYLHVVVTCESLLGCNGKVRCTVRPQGEAP